VTPADLPRFAGLMARLGDAYGLTLKPARVAVYADAFASRPLVSVERAVRLAIESCPKFPSVAELRRLARQDQALTPWTGPLQLEEPRTPGFGPAILALVTDLLARRLDLQTYCDRLRTVLASSSDPRAPQWVVDTYALEDRLAGKERR